MTSAAADQKYALAMAETGDLLAAMRNEELSPDPVRSMLATIWLQQNNTSFMTTVTEAVEEACSPIDQDPTAVMSPKPTEE